MVAAGRDAALARAEEVAPSASIRKAAHETREDLGIIEARDLPIKGYDDMAGDAAIKAIKALRKAEDPPRAGSRYCASQTVVSVGSVPSGVNGPLDSSIWAPSGTATAFKPRLVMTRTGSPPTDSLMKASTFSE